MGREKKGGCYRIAKQFTVIGLLFILLTMFPGCRIFRKSHRLESPTPFGDFIKEPGSRMGSYPTSTVGTSFAGPGELGEHVYGGSGSESNGIVYTCRGGHIDLAHLRKSADWTAFLAAYTYNNIRESNRHFSFRFKEDSIYKATLTYPENWDEMSDSQKEKITREVSVGLGGYFAYIGSTWHEILTWFGYKCTGIYSEYPSAFSWEDSFSNALGCHIAMKALRDESRDYNRAVTDALEKELDNLGLQPGTVAKDAANRVKGKWFSGDLLFFVSMKKRNFDIGLNGYITPWIIPSLSECEDNIPAAYPVPDTEFLEKYGFSIEFRIEPHEWEKKEILKIAYPYHSDHEDVINPSLHFPVIMDHIEEDAEQRYGQDVTDAHSG